MIRQKHQKKEDMYEAIIHICTMYICSNEHISYDLSSPSTAMRNAIPSRVQ